MAVPLTKYEELAIPVWIIDPATGLRIGSLAAPFSIDDGWREATISNTTIPGNSKRFAVPASQEFQILWVYVEFTSRGAAGNRQLVVEVLDSTGDVIGVLARAGVVQATDLTRNYLFGPAVADLIAFRDTDYLTTPIPPTTFLKATDELRIRDKAAINPADDLIVHIQHAFRTVV